MQTSHERAMISGCSRNHHGSILIHILTFFVRSRLLVDKVLAKIARKLVAALADRSQPLSPTGPPLKFSFIAGLRAKGDIRIARSETISE